MAGEAVKRVVQEMSKSDDDQDATKRDERAASAQTNNDKRARDQFNKRNGNAHRPERPSRQKCVTEWQEIFSGMFERTELKYFHHAGHEKDEAENKTGEEESPGAIKSRNHG